MSRKIVEYPPTQSLVHQEITAALGASCYLLDTLGAPFCACETLQVCFKCVKKVKRSPKEPQAQLCFPDVQVHGHHPPTAFSSRQIRGLQLERGNSAIRIRGPPFLPLRTKSCVGRTSRRTAFVFHYASYSLRTMIWAWGSITYMVSFWQHLG